MVSKGRAFAIAGVAIVVVGAAYRSLSKMAKRRHRAGATSRGPSAAQTAPDVANSEKCGVSTCIERSRCPPSLALEDKDEVALAIEENVITGRIAAFVPAAAPGPSEIEAPLASFPDENISCAQLELCEAVSLSGESVDGEILEEEVQAKELEEDNQLVASPEEAVEENILPSSDAEKGNIVSFKRKMWEAQLRNVGGDEELLQKLTAERRAAEKAAAQARAAATIPTFDVKAAEAYFEQKSQEVVRREEDAAAMRRVLGMLDKAAADFAARQKAAEEAAAIVVAGSTNAGGNVEEDPGAAAGKALLAMLKSGTPTPPRS